jgi:hypothetical protein
VRMVLRLNSSWGSSLVQRQCMPRRADRSPRPWTCSIHAAPWGVSVNGVSPEQLALGYQVSTASSCMGRRTPHLSPNQRP